MKIQEFDPTDERLAKARGHEADGQRFMEKAREFEGRAYELRKQGRALNHKAASLYAEVLYDLQVGDVVEVKRKRWSFRKGYEEFRIVITGFNNGHVGATGKAMALPTINGVVVKKDGTIGVKRMAVFFDLDRDLTITKSEDHVRGIDKLLANERARNG
jgi:hypothetical protein